MRNRFSRQLTRPKKSQPIPRRSRLPLIIPRSSFTIKEDGFIFNSTLLLLTLLIPLRMTATARLQTDLHISSNLLSSIRALRIARAGTAVGKDWLKRNLPCTVLPITIGPRSFAYGRYLVTVERLDTGNYRVSAIGQGSNTSRHVVEEIIHIPGFPSVGGRRE